MLPEHSAKSQATSMLGSGSHPNTAQEEQHKEGTTANRNNNSIAAPP